MMKVETLKQCFQEIYELALENGEEIYGETYRPATAVFLEMDQKGLLRVFTLREEGLLIGYAIFLISPKVLELHKILADCVTIFIKKRYRAKNAQRLVNFVESVLKDEVHEIQYRARPAFKNFFKRQGYKTPEYSFVKEF